MKGVIEKIFGIPLDLVIAILVLAVIVVLIIFFNPQLQKALCETCIAMGKKLPAGTTGIYGWICDSVCAAVKCPAVPQTYQLSIGSGETKEIVLCVGDKVEITADSATRTIKVIRFRTLTGYTVADITFDGKEDSVSYTEKTFTFDEGKYSVAVLPNPIAGSGKFKIKFEVECSSTNCRACSYDNCASGCYKCTVPGTANKGCFVSSAECMYTYMKDCSCNEVR